MKKNLLMSSLYEVKQRDTLNNFQWNVQRGNYVPLLFDELDVGVGEI